MTSFFVTKFQSTERDSGRDGLGLLPIWSAVARRCIWNVTTVSSDLAGWRSLLLAAWMAERLAPHDDTSRKTVLLAAERLIAVARWHAPDPTTRTRAGVRGGTRLERPREGLTVAGPTPIEILRSQESTGILGQIGRPAIRTGILTEDLRLSAPSADVAERWFAPMYEERAVLRRWLIDGRSLDLDAPLLSVIARASGSPPSAEEAAWWFDHVGCARRATDPEGRWHPRLQTCVARQLREHRKATSAGEIALVLRGALATSTDPDAPDVMAWLDDIVHVEAVLGPMEALFRWLLTSTAERKTRKEIRDTLSAEWSKPAGDRLSWIDTVATRVAESRSRAMEVVRLPADERAEILRFSDALVRRDPDDSIDALLERNRAVTGRRKRGSWFTEHTDGLSAEFPGTRAALGDGHDWEHGYYLAELASIVHACGGHTP